MSIFPDPNDFEKAIEKAEDHLGAVLAKFRADLIADLERILDERTVSVSFPKK